METTVKRWIDAKGYGFLNNGNGPDILVHKNELSNCTFLRPGVRVSLSCHPSEKGLIAKDVRIIKEQKNNSHGSHDNRRWHGVMT